MDQPNGVCWEITEESIKIINHITYMETFFYHDPAEDINTEDVFFEG